MGETRTKQEIAEYFIEGRTPPPCGQTLGTKVVSYDHETDRVVMEFDGRAEFINPTGRVQGGFLAAMLDDSFGVLLVIASWPGMVMQTLELQTSFIGPAQPGPLTVEAWVIKLGRRIAFVEGHLTDQTGALAATATATCQLTPYKKT